MDASIIAALIGAGTSLASGIGSSYLQGGMNRRQMRYARELANRGLTASDLQAFELNRQAAQEARDFALEMDSTNYQRKIADMQAAGVNPALAIGGVQAAPASSVSASASNTGNVSPVGVNAPDLSALSSLATLPFELRKLKADTKLVETESKGKEIENEIKEKELAFAPARLSAQIGEMLSSIDKNSATARHLEAQREFLNKQVSRYDEVTDAQIAKDYSVVGLNESEREVANATYQKILVENAWLPRMLAAQIANNMASAGLSQKQASMMKFSLIKTVTLRDAESMGVNIWKFGINGSTSKDTMVMICPDDNGKWEIVGLSSSDIKNAEPSNNFSSDDVQNLIYGD